jgi:hypothetical protein
MSKASLEELASGGVDRNERYLVDLEQFENSPMGMPMPAGEVLRLFASMVASGEFLRSEYHSAAMGLVDAGIITPAGELTEQGERLAQSNNALAIRKPDTNTPAFIGSW